MGSVGGAWYGAQDVVRSGSALTRRAVEMPVGETYRVISVTCPEPLMCNNFQKRPHSLSSSRQFKVNTISLTVFVRTVRLCNPTPRTKPPTKTFWLRRVPRSNLLRNHNLQVFLQVFRSF